MKIQAVTQSVIYIMGPRDRPRYVYVKCTYVHKMFIRHIYIYPKTLEIGSGTKLFITFLSLRFCDMRKERHNFFNKRAAHFVDPNWSRRGETKNRLACSEFKSQLTAFFQIPQILSASGHDVIPVPGPISYMGFLL